MTGVRVQTASKERWLETANACPYATYFHTPYWYELIAPKQKHTALEVTFDDGASAVIPIAKIKRLGGVLTDNFSSPGGNYGGWISAAVLNEKHVRALIDVLMSKKNLTFRINPFDKNQISLLTQSEQSMPAMQSSSKIKLTDDHTYIINLTKSIDNLFGEISKGHKSAISFASRNGVTVKPAETLEEWECYYNIYLDSLERWQAAKLTIRTVYPPAFFKRIYENRSGNETLWLVLKDGKPIAGALIFYWGKHAVTWHSVSLTRHSNLRPNNLLYWEIIKDAKSREYTVFDFNPSGGYGGVESFKKSFGAIQIPSPVLQTKTPLRSLISSLRA
jgi:hypothetical protein